MPQKFEDTRVEMKTKVRDLFNLIKIRFMVPGVTFVYTTIIASLVASRGIPNPIYLAYAFSISFFVIIAIYVYNDVMDYEIDIINRVDRPIARGSVARRDGLILALILFILGILSAFRSIETLILSATLLFLGLVYSTPPVRLRNRFLVKHIMPATGQFICSLIGGAVTGNISIQVIYLGFLMFMTVFAGTPIFDIPDLIGDKAGQAKSICVLYGPKFGLKFSIIGFLLVIVVTAVSYPFIGFNVITPIIVTSICLIFIWLAYGLLSNWQNVDYSRNTVKKIIGLNLLYQLAFVFGTLKIG